MNLFEALSLGLVQGLTEFLPVSSSGHLVIAQGLWGFSEPQIMFDIILHLGTLAAVVLFVRRELVELIKVFFSKSWLHPIVSWREKPQFRLLMMILIACVPTALIGFAIRGWFAGLFGSTRAVGVALMATGLILFATRSRTCQNTCIQEPNPARAALMGLAQGLAIIPGISRSGTTIAAGLFLGLERNMAARFSFLLFIPAVFGALLLEMGQASATTLNPGPALTGFFAAALSGYLALVLLLKLLAHGKFYIFAPYCWLLGLISIWAG